MTKLADMTVSHMAGCRVLDTTPAPENTVLYNMPRGQKKKIKNKKKFGTNPAASFSGPQYFLVALLCFAAEILAPWQHCKLSPQNLADR
jgi:hypothetical protein